MKEAEDDCEGVLGRRRAERGGERALVNADRGCLGLMGRGGAGERALGVCEVAGVRGVRWVEGKMKSPGLFRAVGRSSWARADNGVPGRRTSGIPRLGVTSRDFDRLLLFLVAFLTRASLARADMLPAMGDVMSDCDLTCSGDFMARSTRPCAKGLRASSASCGRALNSSGELAEPVDELRGVGGMGAARGDVKADTS